MLEGGGEFIRGREDCWSGIVIDISTDKFLISSIQNFELETRNFYFHFKILYKTNQ